MHRAQRARLACAHLRRLTTREKEGTPWGKEPGNMSVQLQLLLLELFIHFYTRELVFSIIRLNR